MGSCLWSEGSWGAVLGMMERSNRDSDEGVWQIGGLPPQVGQEGLVYQGPVWVGESIQIITKVPFVSRFFILTISTWFRRLLLFA